MASDETGDPGKPDRAMIVLDDNGFVVVWDRAAERLIGYSSDEAIGKHPSQLASREMLALPCTELVKQHSKFYGRYERYHMIGKKSGCFFLAEVTAQIERGPSQRYLTFIWLRPADPGSRSLKIGAEGQTSLSTPAKALLHEFNNLLMVLLAQAELLGDDTTKDNAINQHIELLTEAADRISDVWMKLQTVIEFWVDYNSHSEIRGGDHPGRPDRQYSAARSETVARRQS